jgi:ubiquinone/menaquinone biosynthesis C-methylase UbiE
VETREGADRYYRKRTTSPTARRRLRREYAIVRRLLGDLPPGATVVDAPCGIGPHSRRLKEEGFRVIGVDKSPHMLRHAVADDTCHHALIGDVRALPLADDCAAGALVIRLLHYMDRPEDRRALLREAGRVAPRVVVSFMHPVAVAPLLKARPTRKTQTLATIRADAEAVGLRIARVRPVFPVLKRLWFVALERSGG